jgi:hypothetical protein
MTSKMAEIAVLSALCVLCSVGLGSTHARHVSRVPGSSSRGAPMPLPPAGLAYGPLARGPHPVIPDFTVQYGYVANPGMASGSFGAMLQGRNPAAGAIP